MSASGSTLTPANIQSLASDFGGELLGPDDGGYEAQRRIWNRMIDLRPALIARCANATDARRTLAFARERGLAVSMRGGGHNVSGSSLSDGGVVIDHTLRRRVIVDPATGRVEADPGVLLGELDRATAEHRLAVPVGVNTTTGLAGLTLGGGIGWLMRRDGLACDHLVEADLLLANGQELTVTEETYPELLWALRGGGGNFGIVTRFVFQAVPLADKVTAGLVLFPLDQAAEVLRRYRAWAADLPESVTTIVALRSVLPGPAFPSAIHGRRVVAIGVCHSGDPAEQGSLLGPVRSFGTVLADTVTAKPFTVHQQAFDPSVPPGLGYYWKSHFLSSLSDEAIDLMVEHNRAALAPWSYTLIFQLGGAIARTATTATAYSERDAAFAVNINGVAEDPADDRQVIDWTRGLFDALAPHATGGVYVNFLGNEGEQRVRAAYSRSYERLAALKARYDPENVFRVNQNIRPHATPPS